MSNIPLTLDAISLAQLKTDSTTLINNQVEKLQLKAFLRGKGVSPTSTHQLSLLFPNIRERADLRHIPNDYARSSLFTARNKNEPRKSLLRKELFHYNEYVSIYYSGIELRAEDDEIIWLQILSYGQSVPLGEWFYFSIKDLITDVNWSKNGRYYDKARECISRLRANEVLALNNKAYGKSKSISLISNYTVINDSDGKPTKYRATIDPGLIVLFAGNTFTSHAWEAYRDLSPVARRLADYIESHKQPFPLSVDKFKQMCGSNSVSLTSWKQTVKRACLEIEKGSIANAIVKNNFIYCMST